MISPILYIDLLKQSSYKTTILLISGGVLLLTGTLTGGLLLKMYRKLRYSDVYDETNHVVDMHKYNLYDETNNVINTYSIVRYSYTYDGTCYYEDMFYNDDAKIESDDEIATAAMRHLDEGANIDSYNKYILERKARNDYICQRRNM